MSESLHHGDPEQEGDAGQTECFDHREAAGSLGSPLFADEKKALKAIRDLPASEFVKLLEEATVEQLQLLAAAGDAGAVSAAIKPWPSGLNNLVSTVFAVPSGHRSALSVVAWWEVRRFIFNGAVGLTGLPAALILIAAGFPALAVFEMVLVYGALANICYTLGWAAELTGRMIWKERALYLGPMLLSLGSVFSIGLTAMVSVLAVLLFRTIGT